MAKQIVTELEIIQSELNMVGVLVPLEDMTKWSVPVRAEVEQWAIRERWKSLKRLPCPLEHIHFLKMCGGLDLKVPQVLLKY